MSYALFIISSERTPDTGEVSLGVVRLSTVR